jgi:acyl-CoA thioesterase FadM
MAHTFTTERKIRFSHCDPAGIVYFVNFEFAVTGRVAGEEKFRARHKVALMSLDSQRAMPIPEDMRAKMLPYVKA